MDSFLLKLCWKNIWRNKRRTFLAVNAIAIGVTWLIWAHNYMDALNRQFVESAIRYQNGHIMISADGFNEYKVSKKFIRSPQAINAWLANEESVKAHSPKILAQGLVSSARGSANISYVGVDPKSEKHTSHFHARIVEGSYFEGTSRAKPIVIGVDLQQRLGIRMGSKVVALTQGVDGSIGNELFRVSGIFNSESNADKNLVFIRLQDARSLLSLPENAIHQYSVVLHSEKDVVGLQKQLQNEFKGQNLEIMSWMQIQKHLMASIEIYNAANKIFMFIILFIAAVGIANSILMSIMERTREFGVMIAIGTTKQEMLKMVILETLLLTSVGVVIGNLLGIAVTLYFNQAGFDLSWLTEGEIRMNGALVQTVSYPTVQWIHNISITSVIVFLSFVAAFLPMQHIFKLRATEALKST